LSDYEMFGTVVLSILAGGDTSASLIGQLAHRMLSDDAALWNEAAADLDLIDGMIEEEFRHSGLVAAVEDIVERSR